MPIHILKLVVVAHVVAVEKTLTEYTFPIVSPDAFIVPVPLEVVPHAPVNWVKEPQLPEYTAKPVIFDAPVILTSCEVAVAVNLYQTSSSTPVALQEGAVSIDWVAPDVFPEVTVPQP